jgi:hypothetical protein
MAVTREQFEAGMTYDEFKAQMTRNAEQLEQNERELIISPEDLQAFQSIPRPLNVLAIAEDWCADVLNNLPILGRLARESGKLNVRILLRDQEPGATVIQQYLKEGQYKAIPVFVFLDDEFQERGVFIERPDAVTKLQRERRAQLFAAHPEFGSPQSPVAELPEEVRTRLQTEIAAQRRAIRPTANAEVIRTLRSIVERAAAAPSLA